MVVTEATLLLTFEEAQELYDVATSANFGRDGIDPLLPVVRRVVDRHLREAQA